MSADERASSERDGDSFESAEDDSASDASASEQAGAGPHAYLGALSEVETHIPADGLLQLPLFVTPQVVLFPGGTLPLKEHATRSAQLAALEAMLAAPPETRGVLGVVESHRIAPGDVCCVARVQRMRHHEDGSLRVVAVGAARGLVQRVWFSAAGAPTADVQLLPDELPPAWPPAACTHAAAFVQRLVSARRLAARLAVAPAVAALAPDAGALAAQSPTELSYWAASHLPLDVAQRRALLAAPSTPLRLHALLRLAARLGDLRCAACHRVWARATDVVRLSAEVASGGTFVNPHGFVHGMLTVAAVCDLQLVGQPTAQDSWFAGYNWTIAYCARCHQHAGWRFSRSGPPADGGSAEPTLFWGLRQGAFAQDMHAETSDEGG
jgi:Lon protease-like protein